MFSIDGLVSGLDTTSIIEGLLSIQRGQVDRLELRKQEIQFRQTAFQGIEANVIALQGAARQLNSFTNDVFSVFAAQSSDEDLLQVAAGGNADTGTFQLTVSQLAQAAQISSQGLSSSESLITEGGIEIQIGNRTPVQIDIDANNNTLSGLADSINSATDDVKATVINEGAGYRILLSSQHTGSENRITVNNKTGDSSGSQTRIDFSGAAVQEASDSIIRLGSGDGAIDIVRSGNTVDDVITGLTLKLQQADPGRQITISVSRDNQSAREAIEGFVTAFNNVISYIDGQTAFNAESSQAGLLLGNSATNNIRDQLRNTLARSVANLDAQANRLSAIGIEFNDTGKLQINPATLDNALNGNLEGVEIDDIRRLFSLGATSDSPAISFVSGTNDTGVSADPWQVVVTQAAERASVTTASSLPSLINIDGLNDTFAIAVDGVESGTLKLAHGTYTEDEFAAHLQSVINQSSTLGSRRVSVAAQSGNLVIESRVYGTRSEVGSISGSAAATLGFTGSEYSRGKDVAGYFVVDGQTESATGNGRILSGDPENSSTSGLQLRIALTASQVGTGHQGEITVTRGFAANLERVIDKLLDPDTGRFRHAVDSFDGQIKSIDASVERFNKIFEAKKQQLIDQFVAIESSISSLQNTSSFLASQLGSISQLSSRRA